MLWISIGIGIVAILLFFYMLKRKQGTGIFVSMETALADAKNCRELMLRQVSSSDLHQLGELKHLQKLSISGDALRDLPEVLASMPQLRWLELGATALQSLPDWLGKMQQLESLQLSHNLDLRSAGEFWARLQNLKELVFSNNPNAPLPLAIFELPQLGVLRLQNAWIKELPDAIGNLHQLQQLDISGNALSRLPASFAKLKSLKKLDISNTNIENLDQTIAYLSDLQVLSCDFCKAPTPVAWANCLPHLLAIKELNLNYTNLQTLPDLSQLAQLWQLELLGCDALDWQQAIVVLQKIPNLKALRLPNNADLRQEIRNLLPNLRLY